MNRTLLEGRRNKNDEFYTQLTDIEKELMYYRKHFKDKTAICNVDDPTVSSFFRYFSLNFLVLGLKKLITTCYRNNDYTKFSHSSECHDLFDSSVKNNAVYLEYTGTKNKNEIPSPEEIAAGAKPLKGDGDFRSPECIELLKQADIVVTNPPFSLFREYILQLIEYKKKFLIIGNFNAISYKEIFSLIKDNKIWLGMSPYGMNFLTPEGSLQYTRLTVWFTNLSHKKRNEELVLVKKYKGNEKEYSKYDNYDAIEISKISNIPKDYDGVMGVPITFLAKYNPEQFEILGNEYNLNIDKGRGYVNGKRLYSRIFIKRR